MKLLGLWVIATAIAACATSYAAEIPTLAAKVEVVRINVAMPGWHRLTVRVRGQEAR